MDELEPVAVETWKGLYREGSRASSQETSFSQAISLKRIADALEYLVFGLLDPGDDESGDPESEN